jgi:aryl-alcohol dehydrogenase-like predicted oxidoreductase
VQNLYNLTSREDDALIDALVRDGIAYMPYFPLGGFRQLQAEALGAVAKNLGATPMQIALAWLLQRSRNLLPIPGTASLDHLRENLAAATLQLPPEAVETLDAIVPSR